MINKTFQVLFILNILVTYSTAVENHESSAKNQSILINPSMAPYETFNNTFDDTTKQNADSSYSETQALQSAENVSSNSPAQVKIKKPWPTGALLRSAIIPGWGQFYNKKYIKTVIYGGVETYLIYNVQKFWRKMDKHQKNFQNSDDPVYKSQEFSLYENNLDKRNLHIWLTSLTIFISMFDAYVDAHLADFDQKDKAFEVYITPETGHIGACLVYNF
jgi:hypothetical protein